MFSLFFKFRKKNIQTYIKFENLSMCMCFPPKETESGLFIFKKGLFALDVIQVAAVFTGTFYCSMIVLTIVL